MRLNRRELIASGAAIMLAGCASTRRLGAGTSLNALAQRSGRRFGAAIGNKRGEFGDPNYRRLVADQCGIIVPTNELKWSRVRPNFETFDFADGDAILAFAQANGLAFRGHTLLWHSKTWMPEWVSRHDFGSEPRAGGRRMLADHIRAVCGRYGTRIESYDVVNEGIDDTTGELRETALSKAIGSPYETMELAFRTAREAAPHAQLVYNDYMGWEPKSAKHRASVLRLLERFRTRGVPVDALGIQAHIGSKFADSKPPLGERQDAEWRRFLEQVTAMGYDLLITELDVHENGLPADIPTRDAAVAAFARDYLDLALSFPQLGDILVWGLTDQYSWLQPLRPRPDGQPKRPTPYDSPYRPKPFREAIAAAFAATTTRHVRRPLNMGS